MPFVKHDQSFVSLVKLGRSSWNWYVIWVFSDCTFLDNSIISLYVIIFPLVCYKIYKKNRAVFVYIISLNITLAKLEVKHSIFIGREKEQLDSIKGYRCVRCGIYLHRGIFVRGCKQIWPARRKGTLTSNRKPMQYTVAALRKSKPISFV